MVCFSYRGRDDVAFFDWVFLTVITKGAGALQDQAHFLHERMCVVWEGSLARRHNKEGAAESLQAESPAQAKLQILELTAITSRL